MGLLLKMCLQLTKVCGLGMFRACLLTAGLFSFFQATAQPVVKVAAADHVLKLDYNAGVMAPGNSNPGTDCAAVAASATIQNQGNLQIVSYQWLQGALPILMLVFRPDQFGLIKAMRLLLPAATAFQLDQAMQLLPAA